MTRTIGDDSHPIEREKVQAFFARRARRKLGGPTAQLRDEDLAVAMLYGDSRDALRRSQEEFARVRPNLYLSGASRVLDVGCGVGRWAEHLIGTVGSYVGVDVVEELIAAARQRFGAWKNTEFVYTNRSPVTKAISGQVFSHALVSGVVHYLDDEEVKALFGDLNRLIPGGTLYVRGPFSENQRLTISEEWSVDLHDDYSATYRTKDEFLDLLPTSFRVVTEGIPFQPSGPSRSTKQTFWIFDVR